MLKKQKRNKYYLLTLVAVIFMAGTLYGQTSRIPFTKRQYLYIKHDSSSLEHFESNPNLGKFYNKLDELYFTGQGQVSILHFGGSHIQAGVWSYQLRKLFESISPNLEGAPGFVFPFSMAKTNHPYYYRSKFSGEWEISKITDKEPVDTIGLVGMSARTKDSVTEIQVLFYQTAIIQKRKFDKVTVFHNIDDTSFVVNIAQDYLLDTIIINHEIRGTEFYLSEPIDTFSIEIVKVDTSENEFFFYGALLENSLPSIKYTGVGINGAATYSYHKADLFDTHLKAIFPDLVIFSIGVNDAAGKSFSKLAYINNYKKLADKILDVNPECAIVFTTNNDFYFYRGGVNPHYDEVYDAMVSLAEYYDASVWNMFNVMGGAKSINFWRKDSIAKKDRIHFTRAGYKIIANLLFDAIIDDYEKHLVSLDRE